MSELVPFQSVADPASLVSPETNKNAADIICPQPNCKCVMLKKGTATLVERTGEKLKLPKESTTLEIPEDTSNETQFWRLGNMMDFENIGFSKTVGTVKYLSCADCDIGPLGYHDTADDPKEFLVSIRRARYRF